MRLTLIALSLVILAGCGPSAPAPALNEGASAPAATPASGPESAPVGGPESAAASLPGPTRLDGQGERGLYAFKLTPMPAEPVMGQIFQIETRVTDARTNAPILGATFKLDATMPQHRHGMMTEAVHKELGEGRYLSEGLKLHMPGAWEIRVDVDAKAGHDTIKLPYEQRPVATPR